MREMIGLLLCCVIMGVGANAALPKKDTAPYQPEVYKALRDLEDKNIAQDTRLIALEQLPYTRTIRAEYDVAVQGGAIGLHGLGAALPAKAVITRSWYQVGTQFVDAGSGTVGVYCEDAGNILAATDITGQSAGSLTDGQSTGTVASMVSGIGSNCEITAVVAGAAQTAGKLVVFVTYVVGL